MAKIISYQEFWPYYLAQHAHPLTRKVHAAGSLVAIGLLIFAILTERWWLIAFVPVVGYGFAWCSHFWIEGNRPATWEYPWWSLLSDGRMAWGVLCRRL